MKAGYTQYPDVSVFQLIGEGHIYQVDLQPAHKKGLLTLAVFAQAKGKDFGGKDRTFEFPSTFRKLVVRYRPHFPNGQVGEALELNAFRPVATRPGD